MKNFKIIICLLLMIISNYSFAQNKKLDQMTEEEWIKMKAVFFAFSKIFVQPEKTPKTEFIQTPLFPWDYALKYKSNSSATLDTLVKSMEYNLSDTWGKTEIKVYNYFPMSITKEQTELYSINVLASSKVKNDFKDTINLEKIGYRGSDKYKTEYYSRVQNNQQSSNWSSDDGKTTTNYLNEKKETINSKLQLTTTLTLGESIIEPTGFLDLQLKYVTGYQKILVSKKDINKSFVLNNNTFKIIDTTHNAIVVQCNEIDKLRFIPLNSKLKPFKADYSGEKGFENTNFHTSSYSSKQQYESYIYFNKNKDTSLASFKKFVTRLETQKQKPVQIRDITIIYFERNYAFVYFYMPIYSSKKLKLKLK